MSHHSHVHSRHSSERHADQSSQPEMPRRRHAHTRHQHGEQGEQGEQGAGHEVASQVEGSAEQIAGYLTALADALRSGGVQIQAGNRLVGLRLGDSVTLDLRAQTGDGPESHLALALRWQVQPVAPPAPELHITSLPPHPPSERQLPGNDESQPGGPSPLSEDAPQDQAPA